jgi:hypothetical protein
LRVVGMAQGHYPLDASGERLRRSAGLPELARGKHLAAPAAVDVLGGLSREEARRRVAEAR